MKPSHAIVVGAGIGGLAAAIELAAAGVPCTVLERAATAGGKVRTVTVAGQAIDAGPTVFTMRWVFEQLLASVGARLDDELQLHPAAVLARHAWSEEEHLDLYADPARSADAIEQFAGSSEARGFVRFCTDAQRVYRTLEQPFINATRPGVLQLAQRVGWREFNQLRRIRPFTTLWQALGDYFHDPRLRQLFGRYATYCGASPFAAPATLMLVADVEQQGVWLVAGGMVQLALALERVARKLGVQFRFGAEVAEIVIADGAVRGVRLATGEQLSAPAVVVNADIRALASGALGADAARAIDTDASATPSLSAVTWAIVARTRGFDLDRHNVFFSRDYRAEFDAIFTRGELPREPTVYVCAQDQPDTSGQATRGAPQRLLCLANAPARARDAASYSSYAERAFGVLQRCGLQIESAALSSRSAPMTTTSPADFAQLFPGSDGALYGSAGHGWRAAFRRAGARTRILGLVLAGGSVHPGPGVPMAALSGRLAARELLAA